MTMAYIIFVNPSILHEAGMPLAAVTAATCLAAAVGSLLMGAFARYPIALAPGMGLNAYFTYSVVKGMGIDWHVALGAVFLSGVAFLLLTAARRAADDRQRDPARTLCGGGGGRRPVHRAHRVPERGHHRAESGDHGRAGQSARIRPRCSPSSACCVTAVLLCARVKPAILIGVLATWALAALTGTVHWQPQPYSVAGYHGDRRAARYPRRSAAGLVRDHLRLPVCGSVRQRRHAAGGGQEGRSVRSCRCSVPRLNRILYSDAIATMAGVDGGHFDRRQLHRKLGGRGGGRTIRRHRHRDRPAVRVALFVAPLAGAIPGAATAPALIIVGSMMMTAVAEIAWTDPEIAIPGVPHHAAIPLTFSIANGLAFGFCAYTLIKVLRGRFRRGELDGLRADCSVPGAVLLSRQEQLKAANRQTPGGA